MHYSHLFEQLILSHLQFQKAFQSQRQDVHLGDNVRVKFHTSRWIDPH